MIPWNRKFRTNILPQPRKGNKTGALRKEYRTKKCKNSGKRW